MTKEQIADAKQRLASAGLLDGDNEARDLDRDLALRAIGTALYVLLTVANDVIDEIEQEHKNG